jgi:hypothetical protein
MNPHEILAELDRLQITIWYQQLGPDQDPDAAIRFGTGNKHLYPELQRAVKEKTPELLKLGRFEPSKSATGIYIRKPNPPQAGGPT